MKTVKIESRSQSRHIMSQLLNNGIFSRDINNWGDPCVFPTTGSLNASFQNLKGVNAETDLTTFPPYLVLFIFNGKNMSFS